MSQEELQALINNAAWFTRCGQSTAEPDLVPLSAIATSANWDWLPTSREQDDPIHGKGLADELEAAEMAQTRRSAELTAAKCVWASLGSVPHSVPVLVDGPHDLTPAAKGGAEFAARMAAREIVANRPGLWCRVVELFSEGYWPCGLESDQQMIVVY